MIMGQKDSSEKPAPSKRPIIVWFEKRPLRILIFALVSVVLLWGLNALLLWPAFCKMDARGQFGDHFMKRFLAFGWASMLALQMFGQALCGPLGQA